MANNDGRFPQSLFALIHRHTPMWYTGTGARTEFPLATSVQREGDVFVFVGGLLKRPGVAFDYLTRGVTSPTFAGDGNMVKFAAAPGNGVDVCILSAGGK